MTIKSSSAPRDFSYNPPDTPLDVVFADEHVLVLNKPSGLLTVAGKTQDLSDCLESRAQRAYPTARIVHRLDKDTSGLIVLGLSAQAHAHLGLQFEKRQTSKQYHALIWGQPEQDEGLIDLPIATDWPNRPKQHVSHERGRVAQTLWSVMDRSEPVRIEMHPHTGRTHQLRVHMAHLGHPILGDNLYAHEEALNAAPRLCLHAHALSFFHPVYGTRLNLTSETPF